MTPTRGTRVYRRVVGTTPCAYTVWDEVDTNGGTPGVVWGVDEALRLIDPDDPQVRERLEDMFADDERTDEIVDEILYRLAALKETPDA